MANRIPNTACDLCGQPIYRRPSTLKRNRGKYCSRKCRNKVYPPEPRRGPNPEMKGNKNPAWKGGFYIEPGKGYVLIRKPKHPRARQNGYVLEHILVAERMLGRPLETGEEVHHRNKDKADNRPENLQVYSSHKEHWVKHHLPEILSARSAGS